MLPTHVIYRHIEALNATIRPMGLLLI